MPACKVTVLKKMINPDLAEAHLTQECRERDFGLCTAFEEGQEFTIKDHPILPEGFCSWAWGALQGEVAAIMFGANYPGMKRDGTTIVCCTDGLRPVVFLVERV